MKILRIYIPIYRVLRRVRYEDCLFHKDKRKELIRFMNIPLDEREQ